MDRRRQRASEPVCRLLSFMRWLQRLIVLVFVLALGWDVSRQPGAQWSAVVTIAAIHGYQHTMAPVLDRAGVRCRFTTTCSYYAEAVIRKHGVIGGGWRTIVRLARCGPWTPPGTVDEP
jgi:putative membrane protein insertion efficiency factor